MSKTAAQGEAPNQPDTIEFLDRPAVLKFFGGSRALHTSTLYRGISDGTYPRPVKVSSSAVRWLRSECEAAAHRMLAARDKPQPTTPRRGRPRRRIT
jgi:predicted DNA-binding transcriptional regulator AlpA